MVLLVLMFIGIAVLTAITMSTSQIRSAGDMRASSAAMLAAEGGASSIVDGFVRGELAWLDDGSYQGQELEPVGVGLPTAPGSPGAHGDRGAVWWVESMEFEDTEVTYVVRGAVPGADAERVLEVTFDLGEADTTSPFEGAVVGCNGVDLSGSGRIDSWDSSFGDYAPHLASNNAGVGTLSNSGDIVLAGNAPVHGDLLAGRDIRIAGSASVSGNYHAVQNIIFNGNPSCPSAEVKAGGIVSTPGGWWEGGCGNPDLESGADVSAPGDPCDPLGVEQMVADSMDHYRPAAGAFQNWPHSGWRPNPVHLAMDQAYSSNVNIGPGAHPITVDASAVESIYVDGNFSLTSSGALHLVNPTLTNEPQVVRLLVDGNFNSAGASTLQFDPNVRLVVYSTGRVQFQGGHSQVIPATVDTGSGVEPSFPIYTSFDGNNGVQVGGNSPLSASIYAPLTDVSVQGSGDLYGAVRGATVSVSGSGGIHYDEALGEVGSGGSTEAGDPTVVVWREVR